MNVIKLIPTIIKEAKEWETAAKDFVGKKKAEAVQRAEVAEEKTYQQFQDSKRIGFKW